MRRILALMLLLPTLALGQTAVKLYTTDTVQSACTLAAANETCQVSMVGKTSVGFVVTGNTTPTGMVMVAEESRDGTNWQKIGFVDDTEGDCVWTVTNAQLATNGFTRSMAIGSGIRFARVRLTARTTLATTVSVTATDTKSSVCENPGAGFSTLAVQTSTSAVELIAVPTQVDSVDLSTYITSIIFSKSSASSTAADAHATLYYGTGSNCGTGSTRWLPLAMNVANGGFVWSMPKGSALKAPVGRAVCVIHSVAGSWIAAATYFQAF